MRWANGSRLSTSRNVGTTIDTALPSFIAGLSVAAAASPYSMHRRRPLPARARARSETSIFWREQKKAVCSGPPPSGGVKPSNVGLTANGSPKLLDFGLARGANDAVTRGGTLRCLSPEALSGRAAGEADDVWSLCVILYEMASGEHPFAGSGVDEVADGIRRRRPGRLARPPAAADSRCLPSSRSRPRC